MRDPRIFRYRHGRVRTEGRTRPRTHTSTNGGLEKDLDVLFFPGFGEMKREKINLRCEVLDASRIAGRHRTSDDRLTAARGLKLRQRPNHEKDDTQWGGLLTRAVVKNSEANQRDKRT